MSDPTDVNPDRPGSEPAGEAAGEPRSAAPSGVRKDGGAEPGPAGDRGQLADRAPR